EEPARPDQHEHAVHEPGHPGRTAPADSRCRVGSSLPGRAVAGRPAGIRAAAQRRKGATGPAGSGSRASGKADIDGVVRLAEKAASSQAACGCLCRLAEATGRPYGKMVSTRYALSSVVALSPLPEGSPGAHRQTAGRPGAGRQADG